MNTVAIKKLLVRCGLAAGLLLSLASALDICRTEACSKAHEYTLMGLSMPLIGIVFFVASAVLYELGRKKDWAFTLFLLAVFGASGAEVAFILIQKYRIQRWCPLCLGVAASVYFVAAVISGERLGNLASMLRDRRMTLMSVIRKAIVVSLVFAAGFFAAYKGMQAAETTENVPNIFLGRQSSHVEVFIITDWFCPACMKAEQEIEKSVPAVDKKAKIIFVDVPIHPQTLNYTPYNLSFLTYEKGKYMELRKALLGLTKKKKEPTDDDVRESIKPLNVTYKPLSFLEATRGMKYFDSVAKELQVTATPTVVVRDLKSNKVARFVGINQITAANILKAVEDMAR